MEIKEALALIYKSVSPVLEENGFEPVYPLGVRKSEIPIEEQADKLLISFQGGKGAVRIAYKGERMVLLCTDINASEATDEDYKQASLSLFDPSTADDKDIRYSGNEFSDTVRQKLGKKIVALRKQSFPRPFLNPQRKAAHLPMIRIRLPAGLPPCILNCAKCIKPILKNTATFLRRSSSVSMARRLQCKRFGKMINNV